MAAAAPTQDMPPPGGYAAIPFKRVPARTYFRGWHWFVAILGVKCVGIYRLVHWKRRNRHDKIEEQSAFHAIQPLIFAERDRAMLRQMVMNKENEDELMKNIPGWETGTYFGESIYKTVPADKWIEPNLSEYFAHSPPSVIHNSAHYHQMH